VDLSGDAETNSPFALRQKPTSIRISTATGRPSFLEGLKRHRRTASIARLSASLSNPRINCTLQTYPLLLMTISKETPANLASASGGASFGVGAGCARSSFDIEGGAGQKPLSLLAANRAELRRRRSNNDKHPFLMRRILTRFLAKIHCASRRFHVHFWATLARTLTAESVPNRA
jgi:hypothetical protein